MPTMQENQTARYTVNAGGASFNQRDPKGLEYIAIEDHVGMIGMCELTFTVGKDHARWTAMEVGSDVDIMIGGDSRKIFVGSVTGLRHAFQKGKNTLTVIAMDPLHKLAATRETVVYEEKKDSDIASAVIGRAGASAGTIDATDRTWDYVLQRNESDLKFLRRLASRNEYLLMANSGKVDFKKAQYSAGPLELPKHELISLDYSFSPRDVPQQITTYGWDYANKTMISGTASSGDVATIGGGSNAVDGKLFGGDATISDIWVDSQDSAKKLASSQLNRDARNFMRGRATIQGNGSVYAGGKVKFAGHPTGFNPTGFVVSSRHRIYVRGGFTTEVVFCSNTYPE